MRPIRLMAAILLLALAACAGTGPVIPQEQAAQFQQAIFYEYICEGKSYSNAMFWCGSNVETHRS